MVFVAEKSSFKFKVKEPRVPFLFTCAAQCLRFFLLRSEKERRGKWRNRKKIVINLKMGTEPTTVYLGIYLIVFNLLIVLKKKYKTIIFNIFYKYIIEDVVYTI